MRFRISDKLALQSKAITDQAQIKLSGDYFFALYPSPLGYAEKWSILSDDRQVMRNFNLKNY